MTLVVEDGSGVVDANSYCDVAFADRYLGDRGRTDWLDDSVTGKEGFLIRATSYLDRRWGAQLSGIRQYSDHIVEFATNPSPLPILPYASDGLLPTYATGFVTLLTADIGAGTTLTMGNITYTFTGSEGDDVFTVARIVADWAHEQASRNVSVENTTGSGSLKIRALKVGPQDPALEISASPPDCFRFSNNGVLTEGGGVPQPLEFPRVGCVRQPRYANRINHNAVSQVPPNRVPKEIMHATCEYARLLLEDGELAAQHDPGSISGIARNVSEQEVQVGPVRTKTRYIGSEIQTVEQAQTQVQNVWIGRLYPDADLLVAMFTQTTFSNQNRLIRA